MGKYNQTDKSCIDALAEDLALVGREPPQLKRRAPVQLSTEARNYFKRTNLFSKFAQIEVRSASLQPSVQVAETANVEALQNALQASKI